MNAPSRKIRSGPSAEEIKLRGEVDRLRRELSRLKKAGTAAEAAPPASEPASAAPPVESAAAAPATEGAAGDPGFDVGALRRQVQELSATRQRLSRLYFGQVEENRKRAQRLHSVLENVRAIHTELDLEALLQRIVDVIRTHLGFNLVLMRVREPGTNLLRARAFAGLDAAARAQLEAQDVTVEEFLSWLKDEFKIGRSFFIGHNHEFSKVLPEGYVPDLGKREDWEWHPNDVLLVPLHDARGEVVAYFSVDDPVDRLVPSSEVVEMLEVFGAHAVGSLENARLYRELEAHTRELEEAGARMQEMLALRSHFMSTVSHELRTPLTAIRAYVDTLLGTPEGDLPAEPTRHFLAIVDEESRRLARLIESVLDLNRFDSGTMRLARRSVDLAGLLEESRRLLEPVAQAGQVALKTEVATADTRMDADRDQLRQLVLHLGSNAVQFTPPGGEVTLRLAGDDRDVTLQVEDTGIGIPEEALEKIFERFDQVDPPPGRRYGGTGLGLAICKSIVEWHGGRVFAESKPERGSRFTVVLPRRTGPRVTVRVEERPKAATEDVLRLAIEMVAEVMNARVVSLLAPDAGGDLVIRAALGLDDAVVRDARVPRGTGVAGWVAEHRRPLCVSGDEGGTEVAASRRPEYRTGTFLSVPLEGADGLIGVLNVTDPVSGEPFDAEDGHLLLHLADRVAVAWRQAQTMEQSQADVADSTRALRETALSLERSRGGAPDRVRLALGLARALGLGESDAGMISFAASMLGAGAAPAGERPDVRREALRRRVEARAPLLGPLETVSATRDMVISRHEWWDGSGYPRGLAGEEIPVGGRILAVVAAWESMTVGRAQRPARSREAALEELRRLRERQLDPAVVDVFESVLDGVEQGTDAAAA